MNITFELVRKLRSALCQGDASMLDAALIPMRRACLPAASDDDFERLHPAKVHSRMVPLSGFTLQKYCGEDRMLRKRNLVSERSTDAGVYLYQGDCSALPPSPYYILRGRWQRNQPGILALCHSWYWPHVSAYARATQCPSVARATADWVMAGTDETDCATRSWRSDWRTRTLTSTTCATQTGTTSATINSYY